METSTTALAQQLAAIPVFSDVSPEDMSVARLANGGRTLRARRNRDRGRLAGRPHDRHPGRRDIRPPRAWAGRRAHLFRRRRPRDGDAAVFAADSLSADGARDGSDHRRHLCMCRTFPEMLERAPALGPKLVGVMSDRIRETTKADQQREKLMALGKLSAGLAHELNNPASAVRNAAVNLQQAVRALRTAGLHLDKRPLAAEDRIFLARIECDWSKDHPPAALDSLERSDREEAVGDWLEAASGSGRAAVGPGPGGCRL